LLEERKLAVRTVVQHVAAVRFLYCKTLKRRDMKEDLPYPRNYRRHLPVILSPDEVARVIDSARNLYHRAITAIAALIDPYPGAANNPHVLLVVDQFEELFTLVRDPLVRSLYIDSLLSAVRLEGAVSIHLVLAVRGDFYGHCLDHPELSSCLDTNVYNVRLMRHPQLREAIENRLALAGSRAEGGLVDSLLADVGTEPGNLALLEHALAQLWEKSGGSGQTLTNHAYAIIGRLRGALGRHADEVYRDLGSEADQHLAQRIFLELVQLGDGARDTRRRVAKEALLHLGARDQVERLIAVLASKRLVATGGHGPESPVAT
jgi:hypothetical protein